MNKYIPLTIFALSLMLASVAHAQSVMLKIQHASCRVRPTVNSMDALQTFHVGVLVNPTSVVATRAMGSYDFTLGQMVKLSFKSTSGSDTVDVQGMVSFVFNERTVLIVLKQPLTQIKPIGLAAKTLARPCYDMIISNDKSKVRTVAHGGAFMGSDLSDQVLGIVVPETSRMKVPPCLIFNQEGQLLGYPPVYKNKDRSKRLRQPRYPMFNNKEFCYFMPFFDEQIANHLQESPTQSNTFSVGQSGAMPAVFPVVLGDKATLFHVTDEDKVLGYSMQHGIFELDPRTQKISTLISYAKAEASYYLVTMRRQGDELFVVKQDKIIKHNLKTGRKQVAFTRLGNISSITFSDGGQFAMVDLGRKMACVDLKKMLPINRQYPFAPIDVFWHSQRNQFYVVHFASAGDQYYWKYPGNGKYHRQVSICDSDGKLLENSTVNLMIPTGTHYSRFRMDSRRDRLVCSLMKMRPKGGADFQTDLYDLSTGDLVSSWPGVYLGSWAKPDKHIMVYDGQFMIANESDWQKSRLYESLLIKSLKQKQTVRSTQSLTAYRTLLRAKDKSQIYGALRQHKAYYLPQINKTMIQRANEVVFLDASAFTQPYVSKSDKAKYLLTPLKRGYRYKLGLPWRLSLPMAQPGDDIAVSLRNEPKGMRIEPPMTLVYDPKIPMPVQSDITVDIKRKGMIVQSQSFRLEPLSYQFSHLNRMDTLCVDWPQTQQIVYATGRDMYFVSYPPKCEVKRYAMQNRVNQLLRVGQYIYMLTSFSSGVAYWDPKDPEEPKILDLDGMHASFFAAGLDGTILVAADADNNKSYALRVDPKRRSNQIIGKYLLCNDENYKTGEMGGVSYNTFHARGENFWVRWGGGDLFQEIKKNLLLVGDDHHAAIYKLQRVKGSNACLKKSTITVDNANQIFWDQKYQGLYINLQNSLSIFDPDPLKLNKTIANTGKFTWKFTEDILLSKSDAAVFMLDRHTGKIIGNVNVGNVGYIRQMGDYYVNSSSIHRFQSTGPLIPIHR